MIFLELISLINIFIQFSDHPLVHQTHHCIFLKWSHLIVFNEAELYSILTQLDPNKATGIDNIGPKILKYCAFALTRPLCHLFNLSLASSVIPQQWKVHIVVPVYKSGDRSLVKNYRPISLLCNTSKILESLVYSRIIDFVLNNITKCQFGFLPGRSTTQQLLLYLNNII